VFGFSTVSDPLGVIDFAGTTVALGFTTPVPEPHAGWLMLAGAGALCAVRARRRGRTSAARAPAAA
jgi:hypothetical protein